MNNNKTDTYSIKDIISEEKKKENIKNLINLTHEINVNDFEDIISEEESKN